MVDYTKINKELKKINMIYKLVNDCCISFIFTDNSEAKRYVHKYISSIDTNTIQDEKIISYDFYENRNNSLKNFKKLCEEKGNLIIATGMEGYAEYLKEKEIISNVGIFYNHAFCLPRDDFYLKNNVRIIFIANQKECKMFHSQSCDDFISYARLIIDIDSLLKEDNELQKKLMKKEDETQR